MSFHFSATRKIDTYYRSLNKYIPPIIIIASPHLGSQHVLKAWLENLKNYNKKSKAKRDAGLEPKEVRFITDPPNKFAVSATSTHSETAHRIH
jgi:hypothetical protein